MRGPESHGTPGLHDSKKEAILHVYWAGCCVPWWYLESLVTEVPPKGLEATMATSPRSCQLSWATPLSSVEEALGEMLLATGCMFASHQDSKC